MERVARAWLDVQSGTTLAAPLALSSHSITHITTPAQLDKMALNWAMIDADGSRPVPLPEEKIWLAVEKCQMR